ncbi:MAG: hypothetical protein HYY01_00535 [Chloroflexi bacterium]|nr:hypothetical protein [Chloroflexota bacterium]
MNIRLHRSNTIVLTAVVGLVFGTVLALVSGTSSHAGNGAGGATSGRAELLLTIEEVRQHADFDVALPTYLPSGISFNRAAHDVSLPNDRPSSIGPLTLVFASADGQQGFFLYESAQTTLLIGDKGRAHSQFKGSKARSANSSGRMVDAW